MVGRLPSKNIAPFCDSMHVTLEFTCLACKARTYVFETLSKHDSTKPQNGVPLGGKIMSGCIRSKYKKLYVKGNVWLSAEYSPASTSMKVPSEEYVFKLSKEEMGEVYP